VIGGLGVASPALLDDTGGKLLAGDSLHHVLVLSAVVCARVRAAPVAKLTSGMILQQAVRTHSGVLVVTKGEEVTYPLLINLANLAQRHPIDDKVMARSGGEMQESAGDAVGCILAPVAA